MSNSPLANMKFPESAGGDGDLYVKFKAGEPVKLRVLSDNPMVHLDQWGGTKYAFAVWNFTEDKEMVLDAGSTITKSISQLHCDDDYGNDVTKWDIKITPTGEKMERRYSIQVLPKPVALVQEKIDKVLKLDLELGKIVKNGIRAEEYNNGTALPAVDAAIDERPIDLDEIPY